MITATFKQHNSYDATEHDWYPLPAFINTNKPSNNQTVNNPSVTILGGGIAGMCLAHYFKQANYRVTVIDQQPEPMQGASGNVMAMVMPLLTAQHSPESAFYMRAFEVALRFYSDEELIQVGVEKHLHKAKHEKWAEAIRQSDFPENLLKIKSESTAYYSTAGYVNKQLLAERLQATVDHWITAEIKQVQQAESKHWLLLNQHDEIINHTDLLVVANGIKAQELLIPHDLSLLAKHGMTTTIQPKTSQTLNHIQLAEGYLIPSQNQRRWLCGATFDHLTADQWYQTAELHSDHWQRNLQLWQGHPLYDPLQQAQVICGHAAIRATTPDHLPICGPVIDQTQFNSDYHDLHHGRHWQQYPAAKPLTNLYVLNGLGSRGFTSAPLLAQYLTAMILAEPLPLENDLCKIIHPNRFLYRSLKKTPKP